MIWRTYIWPLPLALNLAGCAPAGEPPARGEISLNFERVSEESLTLTLANGLERAVHIPGERTLSLAIRVWPPDGIVSCRASASSELTTEIGTLGGPDTTFVAIAPGKRVKIVIPTMLPHRSKGGYCDVYLDLKDGTRVGPVEFRP